MLNLILFGPPGSGKGTQSALICEKFNLKHVSTGEILREEIKKQTALGVIADSYIKNGQLVPDKMIIDILLKNIEEDEIEYNGIILDGFPRTLVQAEVLEQVLHKHKYEISVLIELYLDDEVLIERLLNRGLTSGRSDDNLEAIKNRLEIYKIRSTPASAYYKKLNKYVAINGLGTVDDIFQRLSQAIESKLIVA